MSPRTDKQFEEIREKSKDNIVDSALDLFSEKGFFNTSVRQIAKKANVSIGLMYNYFSSKEELLTSITNKALKLIDNIISDDPKLSAEENIEKTLEQFFQLLESKRKLLRMMTKISFQLERFGFVIKMIEKKYIVNIEVLGKYLKKLGYDNPETEAALLIATMDGVMYQSLTLGEMIPVDDIKNQLIKKYCGK